ncbi:ABC transporter family substrate-binding protein [Paeniglutamicibacter antarcticus]|uniref:ABC transporter family substrate-binding protein n=1 Tax=Arthrobacter terrae TaxID=2935737 RepID=A0A931CSZ2_9MICC|nr:ABC transporter family substrate-binding protein [Arthrobacter terrae]MBG0740341.1 ABC transporter family substrate-binding protein [Arthrobacter terrae]
MRFGRISKAVGAAAAAVLILSGCTGTPSSVSTSSGTSDGAVGGKATVAETNAFNSFNPSTGPGSADINSKIAYATHSGFNYVDNQLNVVKNDKFGKYEKVSDDPLTIKYTINDGVKWSDGAPVDANDLMLAWAAQSGYFNDASVDSGGKVVKGTQYFDFGGAALGNGSALATTDLPEIGDNGQSLTLKYAKPFADWEIAFGSPVDVPAHVVAQKAGLKDAAALSALFKSLPRGNPDAPVAPNTDLNKVAQYWNSGFDTKTMPKDTSVFLSNGPYIVTSMVPEQSLTLSRNTDYKWGPAAKLDSITVRFMADVSAQVTALKNGEVDIISPQPTADTTAALQALAGQSIAFEQFSRLSYDHLDLTFSGVFADQNVRQAFLKTIPRQEIVRKTVQKTDAFAKPLESEVILPEQPGYADTIKDNGSSAFAGVDIEGAKRLLNGATPTVRIMYSKANTNRAEAFTLIAQSASQAGFKIIDDGLGVHWSQHLGDGSYDAAIFGWNKAGVGVSAVPELFRTGGASNYNNFSNAQADKLMDQLIVTDNESKQVELLLALDKIIWGSDYGLPLFQYPRVVAHDAAVLGVEPMPGLTGVWWNYWQWARK